MVTCLELVLFMNISFVGWEADGDSIDTDSSTPDAISDGLRLPASALTAKEQDISHIVTIILCSTHEIRMDQDPHVLWR